MKFNLTNPGITSGVVTATSLFDGHDASINIFRRILQGTGAEVIHLGHNRSVQEIVDAAVEEDVQGLAVSSYQGGHVEFFKYMIDLLNERGAGHIKVFGGGGGVIVPEEIRELGKLRGYQNIHPRGRRQAGTPGHHQPHGRIHGLFGLRPTMVSIFRGSTRKTSCWWPE